MAKLIQTVHNYLIRPGSKRAFLLMSAALELFYLVFFAIFLFADSPNLVVLKTDILPSSLNFRNNLISGGLYIISIGGLFALYFIILASFWGREIEFPWRTYALWFCTLFSVTLVILPPFMSTDVFQNAIRGRVAVVYGQNPYLTPPDLFPKDPFVPYIDPGNITAEVPFAEHAPFWIAYETLLARVFGGNIIVHLLAIKATMAVVHLASILLVYKMLSYTNPRYQCVGTILYAYSPLILIESVGMGHNDVVMMFFALLFLYLSIHKRYMLAAGALAVSIMTKYVTAVFLPPYLFLLYQQTQERQAGKRIIGLAKVLLVVAVVASFALLPFGVAGPIIQIKKLGSLELYTPATISWLSREWLTALLHYLVRLGVLEGNSIGLAGALISKVVLTSIWLVQYVTAVRQVKNEREFASFAALTVFLLMLLVFPVWRQWYMVWFLCLVSVAGKKELYITGSILSCMAMLIYVLRPKSGVFLGWYPF